MLKVIFLFLIWLLYWFPFFTYFCLYICGILLFVFLTHHLINFSTHDGFVGEMLELFPKNMANYILDS